MTFTSIDVRNRSNVSSSTATEPPTPALFTSTSTRPNRASTSPTRSSTIGFVGHVGDDDVCPGKLGGERLEPLGSPGSQHHLRANAVEYGREVRAESEEAPVTTVT